VLILRLVGMADTATADDLMPRLPRRHRQPQQRADRLTGVSWTWTRFDRQ